MTNVAEFTVLVVEDHDFQRRTILQILANLGVGSLLEAADGEAALTVLDSGKRPDIVVCDLDMPGMDGVELVRHIADRHSAVAVIFASGLEDRVVAAADRMARAYGVTVLGAIPKPLTARRLLAAIGEYSPAALGGTQASSNADELDAALDRGEIELQLRPVVEIATGALSAAALLPGPLSPRLMAETCAIQLELADAGHDVPVSVAAADDALADLGLPDRWAQIVSDAGGTPAKITIEVDERAVSREDATVLEVLTRLRLKGFRLALASSDGGAVATAQLERGPFVAVRIAAGILAEALGAGEEHTSGSALEASIERARGLGLETEAAGCTDRTAWELLAALGCERASGAFVAEPMAPGELAGWASTWSPEQSE
ncbi:MAG: EAL domain-containing protein [Solirubrobacterales bacterium]